MGKLNEYPGLRNLIGGLLFIARSTKPDILFGVNYLSRFQSEGTEEIYRYALRILKYLKTTSDYGLLYTKGDSRSVTSYIDSSFADVKDLHYESIGGSLIFANRNLVSWATRKQK